MPDNDANHSRLPAFQPPMDWDDAVCEMLLSMADDASARTPTTDEDLDLDLFKRSLGSAPPAKFNSEGGLREPWADGVDLDYDIANGLEDSHALRQPWADRMDLDHDRGLGTTPGRDSSTRGSSRIETDTEATVRKRRDKALTAALVLLAYALAAFWWSITDWQRQIESAPPPQNQSVGTVLSPGLLLGSLTVEELALLKGLVFIFPVCSFAGAVAALLVRGRCAPRFYRRFRPRIQPGSRCPGRGLRQAVAWAGPVSRRHLPERRSDGIE
jgi:hypothetical protein